MVILMFQFIQPSEEEKFVVEKIKIYEEVIDTLSNRILDLNIQFNNLRHARIEKLAEELKDTHISVCFCLENDREIIYDYWEGFFPKESYPEKFLNELRNDEGFIYTQDINKFKQFIDIVKETEGVIDKSII